MADNNQGLYNKFKVTRTDGQHRKGKKHEGCEYFVLDLTHDPFARAAISAYADQCAKDNPALAHDLRKKVAAMEGSMLMPQCPDCGLRAEPSHFYSCPHHPTNQVKQ